METPQSPLCHFLEDLDRFLKQAFGILREENFPTKTKLLIILFDGVVLENHHRWFPSLDPGEILFWIEVGG